MRIFNGREILESLNEVIHPHHTALLIMDMTNDFLSPEGKEYMGSAPGMPDVLSLIPRIKVLLDCARRNRVLCVFVQNQFLPGGRNIPVGMLYHLDRRGKIIKGDNIPTLDGTWGCQVISELRPLEDETVITKHCYSGFSNTHLDLVLRNHEIKTIVPVGAASSGCILATAIAGYCLDYYVAVPRECTAAANREWHEAAMKLLSPIAVSVKDVMEIWDKASIG